jgi:N utilization substance protein B
MVYQAKEGIFMSNMTRHEIREAAFILIFERMFQNDLTVEQTAQAAQESDLFDTNEDVLAYVTGVEQNQQVLDEQISKFLVKWTINRISKTSLAILRLAVYEMMFCDKIDNDVAISEAVILTNAYGYPEDVKFVNGLLGNLNRSLKD